MDESDDSDKDKNSSDEDDTSQSIAVYNALHPKVSYFGISGVKYKKDMIPQGYVHMFSKQAFATINMDTGAIIRYSHAH